jgi:hypothetical protein
MMAMMVEQQQQLMMAAMSQFAGMGHGRGGRGRYPRGRGGRQGSRSLTYKRKEREETAGGQEEDNERRAATKQKERGEEPKGEDGPTNARHAKAVGGGAGTDAEARAKLMEETRKRIEYLERLANEKKKEGKVQST